ncbi:MAG: hypothetical protein HC903_22725 [Methylacidiphilales bacterium]|nr:hypothetical protein [Candidatus Methylacidiphilales bacterium]NJR18434.1 hypothetical protein [Calothrix sp. CSU_2_0]
MSERENYNPQHHYSKYLHGDNISSLKCEIKDNWSPSIEKGLIAELKSSIKRHKNPEELQLKFSNSEKFQLKFSCLLIVILALLSIGMSVQADAIAQALREIARMSVQQTIRINNQ